MIPKRSCTKSQMPRRRKLSRRVGFGIIYRVELNQVAGRTTGVLQCVHSRGATISQVNEASTSRSTRNVKEITVAIIAAVYHHHGFRGSIVIGAIKDGDGIRVDSSVEVNIATKLLYGHLVDARIRFDPRHAGNRIVQCEVVLIGAEFQGDIFKRVVKNLSRHFESSQTAIAKRSALGGGGPAVIDQKRVGIAFCIDG